MKRALLLLSVVACANDVIYLWPESQRVKGEETIKNERIATVPNPNLTVFLPDPDIATGMALVIAPGGGHHHLAIDHEGYDVARWLNKKGIAAFLLRYRLAKAEGAVKAAGERIAGSLKALSTQLKSQQARGVNYFIGDALSALDIYWTAFANLLDPLPKEQCPMPEAYRPGFTASDPVVKAALDPLLLEHRTRIFRDHFRNPMEL
mgnify:CR=1 FL=1